MSHCIAVVRCTCSVVNILFYTTAEYFKQGRGLWMTTGDCITAAANDKRKFVMA